MPNNKILIHAKIKGECLKRENDKITSNRRIIHVLCLHIIALKKIYENCLISNGLSSSKITA